MYPGTEQELLGLLAERVGISSEYHDIGGTLHVTTDETKRAILAAMGYLVHTRDALAQALAAWDEAPWRQPCDPILILKQGYEQARWSLRLPLEGGEEQRVVATWQVSDEQGEVIHQEEAGPRIIPQEVRYLSTNRYARLELPVLPGLMPGYYDLIVSTRGGKSDVKGTMRIAVTPAHCYVPEVFDRGGKIWGLALQLYSLRSLSNWGAGDFTDLGKVVEWAGRRLGAGIIGLNPLHALKNSHPHHLSPYAPNSRLFLNELYIDLERLPEFHASPDAQRQRQTQEFRVKLESARKADRVDYDAVASLKRTMLDLAYRQFLKDNYSGVEPSLQPTSARGWLLERFIKEEGESLEQFAVFQVLEEERRLVDSKPTVWHEWPKQYITPTAPAVKEFAKRHRKRVRFFQYIQWIAADQLKDAGARASQLPMTIGLYCDLALGSDRSGAEAWMLQEALALDADCGAPPDAFAPQGQNWGFAPFHPHRLKAAAYRPFIELLRKNLRQGGAIRIDHVMALFRLFWVPRGLTAAAGAYVQQPAEDLLSLLALESVRARTLVIGEDLGTVPDYVREQLARYRILSYRVFYFERNWDGTCKPPSAYPSQSLAVVTTHDLPTLAGYWLGEDIYLRAGLGMYANEQAKQQALEERARDKGRILSALRTAGLLPPGISEDPGQVPGMTKELCDAIHAFLGRSDAWIVMANLDDLIGEVTQMNLPGTVDAYPNWSRKLSLSLEELQRDDRAQSLAAVLQTYRQASSFPAQDLG
jgi:4-alpha-glucanotransferase